MTRDYQNLLVGLIHNSKPDTKDIDGSQTLVKSTGEVTDVASGTKIILNEDFQWGDFGTSLITLPTNSNIGNAILGDLKPVDFET